MPSTLCRLLAFAMLVGVARPGSAAVVVLANRTTGPISFAVSTGIGEPRRHSLASGEVTPIRAAQSVTLTFLSSGRKRQLMLEPNAAYFFGGDADGGVRLERIGLGEESVTGMLPPQPSTRPRAAADPAEQHEQPVTIRVKVLVDEEEPARKELWEARLRRRVEQLSEITERTCFVRFQVTEVGTWQSDNRLTDFARSLAEFEGEVDPAPARLAIGFTSQYHLTRGRTHLGGTRGPLRSHILLREWAQHVSEPERLELLVHEIGHFLGAAHSPEPDSVMRPVLGDRQANARSFRIGFDPVSTLAMNIVSEQLRGRPVRSFADMSLPARLQLRGIYSVLDKALPEDPTALRYLDVLDRAQAAPWTDSVRAVVQAVSAAAVANARRPAVATAGQSARLQGDELASHYFRKAAAAAKKLPPEHGPRALLLGLAVALDKTDQLRGNPLLGPIWRSVETDAERKNRIAALGNPTAQGRYDLLQHFTVSAAITAIAGSLAAETAGLAKERSDASGGSGFSFVDYQADLAGIGLARRLLGGKLPRPRLESGFELSAALPPAGELPEGLTWKQFEQQFGSLLDPRFRKVRGQISAAIEQLPLYGAK